MINTYEFNHPSTSDGLFLSHHTKHDVDTEVPYLVAEVFQKAPAVQKSVLLRELLRPLGILSLAAVANGVFARIQFHNERLSIEGQLNELQQVRPMDMVALVNHVEQVSAETVDSLAQLLFASTQLAGSAAAAMLMIVRIKRAKSRRTADCPESALPQGFE